MAENQPPMYLTLYFLTTHLPDSLRTVRDHFLSLDPTELTLASFETRLLEAETSAHAVAAPRGSPLPFFFEGCSPSLLAPSVASAVAMDFLSAEEASVASAPGERHPSRGGGSGGGGGGGSSGGGGGGGGGGRVGSSGGGGSSTATQGAASGGVETASLGAGELASTGLHLFLFATNLVSTSVLQDMLVTTTTPGGELVAICTDTVTGDHLATFTQRPGSGLYTLHTESAQMAASSQVAASCLCRLLTHPSPLPAASASHALAYPCLRPPEVPAPAPTSLASSCTPCVEGWQRAAPHSSLFPPTSALLQTLF
ncbi:unnamed protein product [Closterium sp. NIES-53]